MNYKVLLRGLLAMVLTAFISHAAVATSYQGHVKFGNVSVPGVMVIASQGDKKVSAITDEDGMYSFPDLANGTWTVELEMSGFAKLKEDVTIAPDAPPKEWELKMLPLADISTVKAATLAAPATGSAPAAAASAPA